MVLIIDNYDSFVYNLAQYVGELGQEFQVFRNDAITVEQIEALTPSHIIISPGPCTPKEAGVSNDVIRALAGRTPILGVCLGHQCLGYVYGAVVDRAKEPVHGKSSLIYHDGQTIYRGIPNPLEGGRYHSLVVYPETLPPELIITARTQEGEVMGLRHRELVVVGVQFHPESVLTPAGHDLLRNFLAFTRPRWPG